MLGLRTTVKLLGEKAIRAFGMAARARSRHRLETIILCYHNIVPDGERTDGDTSLHLPQHQFARQMDQLLTTHDIVALRDLDSAPGTGRPRAVITFDDACTGALTAGVEELAQRAIGATFFVAPGTLGKSFWWDAVRERNGMALGGARRDYALTTLRGQDIEVREWARRENLPIVDVPAHQFAGSPDEIRNAVNAGMEVGSHSWSHPNLASLPADELRSELASSMEWLKRTFPATLLWLAYPYGLSSPNVEAAAQSAGYTGGLLIEGGWMQSSTNPFRTPRQNIGSGVSIDGFEIRASGLRS